MRSIGSDILTLVMDTRYTYFRYHLFGLSGGGISLAGGMSRKRGAVFRQKVSVLACLSVDFQRKCRYNQRKAGNSKIFYFFLKKALTFLWRGFNYGAKIGSTKKGTSGFRRDTNSGTLTQGKSSNKGTQGKIKRTIKGAVKGKGEK